MNLQLLPPHKALNKAYLKEKVNRSDIEAFKANLKTLLSKIDENESEEHHKYPIKTFLQHTWYKELFEINTKDRADFVIHNGKTAKDTVGVILEVKSPTNQAEMISGAKPNKKAMHELILYYLRERIDNNQTEVKHLLITNIWEWYIFDEKWFENNIYRSRLKKEYEAYKLSGKDTKFFYDSIAKPFLDELTEDVPCTYFDFHKYEKIVTNDDKKDDNKLIALYKLLSPAHLLKQPFANDSNSLDTKFYIELLHIIGLEEKPDGGKKLIRRKEKPDPASLLESTIMKLEDKDCLRNISNSSTYGNISKEQYYNVALELCITWINRILFIKLLEGQLVTYHKGNKDYLFLNTKTIGDYDELNDLFFQVLAERTDKRRDHLKKVFARVPYLNSSLFDRTTLEREAIEINALNNRMELPLASGTVLKDEKGKKRGGGLNTLQYLFEFLDAYDFSSDGGEEIQEQNKNLINASVLGLIFEKINGYKDGSFFTPGFVTMYMCRETIRRSVVQKFNDAKGWQCENLDQLEDKITDKKEANNIINSLKICDPAVGSGHFLVSALNEIITIKSKLKILLDRQGKTLRDYTVAVENDALVVTNDDGELFDYRPKGPDSQRIQEALFHEKENIIENCLFGVDINPNSVKICRLRLWIELLKNAYYTAASNYTELETLPNIDINIKCGNSLISKLGLQADISYSLEALKYSVEDYKRYVNEYKNADDKQQKNNLLETIKKVKLRIYDDDTLNTKENKELQKLRGQYLALTTSNVDLFGEKVKKEVLDVQKKRLLMLIADAEKKVAALKENVLYKNAFEWRFEFPEILDSDGNFIGFDVVIGNPPYLSSKDFDKKLIAYLNDNYKTAQYQLDLYVAFIERAVTILKQGCIISFITPNSWLKNMMFSICRKYLLDTVSFEIIFPNLENVFDEASVDTLIFLAKKDVANSKIDVLRFNKYSPEYKHSVFPGRFKGNERYVFDVEIDDKIYSIIQKIRNKSVHLGTISEITRGVNPYDKQRGQSEETISSKAYHSSFQKDDTFLPEIRGKHVNSYSVNWDGKHFISYGNWLAAPREMKFFTGSRIIMRQVLGVKLNCTIIDEDFIIDQSVFIAKPNENYISFINAIQGCLASKLISFYFKYSSNEFDALFPKIKIGEFKELPVYNDLSTANRFLFDKVEYILKTKKMDVHADTTALEKEIDQLVYQLYGLTEEEIKIVEGTN